ncbi:hypothetical protein AAMO2058_001005900 [Amorphochlora amoebiformis]
MRGPCFALIALFSAYVQAQETFSFQDYLPGEWKVERFSISPTTSEMTVVSTGKYVFNSKKESTNIDGSYTPESDAEEEGESVSIPVLVEFDSSNTGNFKTGDDEDLLFSFYFQHFSGPWISHGEWNGQTQGIYQFNIVAPDRFTITVYPTNSEEEMAVISVTRVKSGREKSFFEKYGSTIMMVGGFLLFQRLKGDPGRGAATGGGGGQPTVEEKVN